MVTTMKQKVTRGAKWLDKNYKGWARKVKITRLNLANHCYCILGQLYGEYKTGLHILHKKGTWKKSCSYGFNAVAGCSDCEFDGYDYELEIKELQKFWLLEVRNRRLKKRSKTNEC